MPTEEPRRRKFTQLVPHHILGDVYGYMAATIVNGDRVTDELRKHCRRARPRLYHAALTATIQMLHLLEQFRTYEWSLFQ